MTKKRFTFLGIIVSVLIFLNFMGTIQASSNNSSLTTVANIVPAKKIKNGKDAYELIMKYHKTNSKNSSYKNARKIKNGYAIAYYNDVGQLTIYRVTLNQNKSVQIKKQHDKKVIQLNNKKLNSSKDAVNALRDALHYKHIQFKSVTRKPNMFIVKVFRNNKYLGTYYLRSITKQYNKIIEDDSRFLSSANSHEMILNNKESKHLSSSIKTVRKYRNKKLTHAENKQFVQAKKVIAHYNKD
ncbi:hypothetical protein [Apilactobacillus micheneri]|uniref:hypothetical protein n=1 Tax=Apilactobacillus micheneri TaxID=1899430 RepID=UPI00112B7E6E|nr:hypothetical protein [Apilactobacillus micheneri]TPR50777.1 hypothetical protein DY126_06930 [Apilactobacillus micheneri]